MNKKNKIILLTLFFILIIILYFIFMQYIIPKNMNIESSNEELYNNDKIKISLDASINMRIMLADILNYGENILITEDNIDNTLVIIEKENL